MIMCVEVSVQALDFILLGIYTEVEFYHNIDSKEKITSYHINKMDLFKENKKYVLGITCTFL